MAVEVKDEKGEVIAKVAVNREEAFWVELKDKCEKLIRDYKHELIIQEHILKFCEEKAKV